jgi:hypothetical protein
MTELSEKAKKLFTPEQLGLIKDGFCLLNEFSREDKTFNRLQLSDYSFLVAPFAKAYEGFLKLAFLRMGLIDEFDYHSDHFRVGKVLNPNLRYKKFSVYRKLEKLSPRGSELASLLWQAWKNGRNLVFHYFPHNLHRLSFEEAKQRINRIIEAIDQLSLFLDKS